MASVDAFLRENKVQKQNVKLAVSESFVNKNGKPMLWEIRPISAEEEAQIGRKTRETARDNSGRKYYIPNDNDYMVALCAQSVVFPDLGDKTLQASYDAFTKAQLLRKMLTTGELQKLALKVIEVSGLNDSSEFEEDFEEVKNS